MSTGDDQIVCVAMFCPRCGTENDAGNRFCVSCGSELGKLSAGEPAPSPSLRQRFRSLVGTNRRAQLLSAATAIAIVIAIVAFVALEPDEGGESRYLQSLDRACVTEKERLSSLEAETLGQRPPNLEEFASVLVTIVAEWRSNLRATPPPTLDSKGVRALEAALLRTLIESGTLARLVRERAGTGSIAAQSSAVDEATREVNGTIAELGLEACAKTEVAPVG